MYSVTEYYYQYIIRNRLFSKFGYKKSREIPRLLCLEVRIILSELNSVGSARVQQSIELLELLLGKKPMVSSRSSRYVKGTQQLNIVIKTSLVKKEMYRMFDYIIHVMLPVKYKQRYLDENVALIGKEGKLYIKDIQMFYNLRTDFVDFKEQISFEFKLDTNKMIEKRDVLRSFNIPVPVSVAILEE